MGPERRSARAMLALLVLGLASAAGAVPAHDLGPPEASYVPGVGWIRTHGPDLVQEFPLRRVPISFGEQDGFEAPPIPPTCAPDPPHFRMVYARPVDAPDGYHSRLARLREVVNESNGLLRAESMRFGTAIDYRILCDSAGQVDVARVVFPWRSSEASFNRILASLAAQGYNSHAVKYWVFFEGSISTPLVPGQPTGAQPIAGQATWDPDALITNTGYAVAFREANESIDLVMMHESAHVLGAVHYRATHATGDGHCNEGLDVMCPIRPDHGVTVEFAPDPLYGHRPATARCGSVPRFDCGNDDYFHPNLPAPVPDCGSLFAEFPLSPCVSVPRNLGNNSTNVFFDFGPKPPRLLNAGCAPSPAMPGESVTCAMLVDHLSDSVTYRLDWGDGLVEQFFGPGRETISFLHTYAATGTYTVAMNASTPEGSTVNATERIVVQDCVLLRHGRIPLGLLDQGPRPSNESDAGRLSANLTSRIEADIPPACGGRPYSISVSLLSKFNVEWLDASGETLGERTPGIVPLGANAARVISYFGVNAEYRLRAG